MTREEFSEIYSEKSEQINRLKSELFKMKREYIEEHKQIRQIPVKIHFIHQYAGGFRKEPKTIEQDAYIVGYGMSEGSYSQKFTNKVYPILKDVKKNGDISLREYHYPKYRTFRFWEIGKEDEIFEIDFGEN